MGWNPIKKIKKAAGKVFGGITKGLDKLTGGKFSKIMGNKWVQGALMAVAVVTGGIAIANGVMAAGNAGIGAAAKSFAANMSMETGKSLVGTLIEGGKQFVGGVAKGLANPLKSDAGQALAGTFESAVSNITGTPLSGADQLAVESNVGGGTFEAASFDGNIPNPTGLPSNAAQTGGGLVESSAASGNPANWAMPGDATASDFNSGFSMGGQYAPGAREALNAAGGAATAMPEDLLTKLGKGVTNYATSPMGIYQAGSALQGWASGQSLQEQWDRMDEAQKKIYRSWTDGSSGKPPKLAWNPVPRVRPVPTA